MARTHKTVKAELDALRHQAQRYTNGMNEGGEGYNPHAAQLRALEAEYDALCEATATERAAAMQDAEWTLAVTQQRRADWNAWVRSQGKTIAQVAVARQMKAQGWSVEALKAAITRHGL